MANEYNYNEAIHIIVEAFNIGENVPYEALEKAMGLKTPIISSTPANNCALAKLKKRLKEEHGLTIKSVNTKGGMNNYYVISKVKDEVVKKKDSKVEDSEYAALLKNYEALSKNNEKLYTELEDLKAANAALEMKYRQMREDEQKFITIINSLMSLARLS